ncbi:MAG: beta-N-acetylhexosaminidase [Bacteroidota bacterium]|nr:beta-N-acetylhexosaminidase [Bacteroidota bacterium]
MTYSMALPLNFLENSLGVADIYKTPARKAHQFLLGTPSEAIAETQPSLGNIIPLPAFVLPVERLSGAESAFTLKAGVHISVVPATAELKNIGQYLAERLNVSTGYEIPVTAAAHAPAKTGIQLALSDADPTLGDEGYLLTITQRRIFLTAYTPAGIFRGIQTLRQMLPPEIESPAGIKNSRKAPWSIPAGTIRDVPRFSWRGVMLDVARHFFSVKDVERLIDLMAYYKMNRFHLHLSDDQGWRLMINSWPQLATYGGSMQVGGAKGGYYTQEDYAHIVEYAQQRYITVIPEIDMPGHTNAALASYPELNCNGAAPPLYSGIDVGFSALCVDKEITYTFVNDVIREIAALTPGSYIHVGGDEVSTLSVSDYSRFIERVQTIVQSHGKQMIGWAEIAQARLSPSSIAQHWKDKFAQLAVQQHAKVIMSPAQKLYMDIKYNDSTQLGLIWAGYIGVKDAYEWEPSTIVNGVTENDILGIEAALWSETIQTMEDIEYMVFPRLPGYAEIGWSQAKDRTWREYEQRLASHGSRLRALGVNFYPSPEVAWK